MLRSSDDQPAAIARTAEYLADLPAAWGQATAEQRNELARVMFGAICINDNRVEAVKPQPEFAPFFLLDYAERSAVSRGSDGVRQRVIKPFAHVPVLLTFPPDLPKTTIPPACWPEIQDPYVAGESLRTLAASYDVSYETIRSITQRFRYDMALTTTSGHPHVV